ncbi:MAG TPA: PilC/PilY family type IV pilus protein [Gammaproteobacteria bacterium]
MKQTIYRYFLSASLAAVVFLSSATPVHAANLSIANTPLFLGAAVQPNVFFVSDDSGSMDWEYMTGPHWRWYNYDPDPIRDNSFDSWEPTTSQNTSGLFDIAEFDGTDTDNGTLYYNYSNSDNVYGNSCYYGGRAESCADSSHHPLDVDWRGRSTSLNRVFYNADIQYEPWDGPCNNAGDPCEDASFTAARSNPFSTQPGYSITRNLEADGDFNNGPFIYEVWIDDSGYTNSRPNRGSNFDATGYAASGFAANTASDLANGEVDLWDSHMRFTVSSSSVDVQLIAYNPKPDNPDRGLNETALATTTLSGAGCYNILGTDAMVRTIRDDIVADQANAATYMSATGATGCRTIAETAQNVANWYQYYRRRSFPVKNAIAEIIDSQPTFRFGMTLINRDDLVFNEVPDISLTNFTAHNTEIKRDYFAYEQNALGTPLRRALRDAGEYYADNLSGKDNPIIYSCQKNFTILFTDGAWSGYSASVENPDGDNRSETLADVAYKYYMNDLSTLEDNVKPDLPLESDLPLVVLDPNYPDDLTTHQHMVTFTVAFGVSGNLVDNDGDGNPDFDAAGNDWSTPGVPDKNGFWSNISNDAEKTDDLWHAAYNSAGVYASASSPTEVSEKLIKAIAAINARVGSAAAVALNSGTLNANSRLYQARFDSNGWSGNLFSVPIQDGPVDRDNDGNDDSPPECDDTHQVGALCEVEWNAGYELSLKIGPQGSTHTKRKIYTMETDTYTTVEFKDIFDLSSDQRVALRTDPDTLVVEGSGEGQDRLDYLRGDHSLEADQSGGRFRIRNMVANFEGTESLDEKNVLGDIINSSPAYVGAPDFSYPDSLETDKYSTFKYNNRNREPITYVGANDGMLHAFDALTGEERFAYVPGALVKRLNLLTSLKYNSGHTYFVDGSPQVFDAYNSGWKTMLASSVGAGGQIVFGMDITNPDAIASNTIWEFTDHPRVSGTSTFGDADLGFTIGDVSYAKMNNGQWVVIFGNGYNNTHPDDHVSTTGNGVIYVVNAFTGALVRKFDTGIGMVDDPTGANRPNGVATVTPVDMDGDFKVDALYAGDLFGNVWKVDVTSSTAGSWDFAYKTGTDPKPVFVARDAGGTVQPISSAIAVKRHPIERDQTLLLFGTGKYFEVGDSASAGAATQIQTFYGVWDDNNGLSQPQRSDLMQQRILEQDFVEGEDDNSREFRVTSSERDDTDYRIDWSTDKGWFMDLRFGDEYGERVVVNPIIRNNRVIFVTTVPNEDPCGPGGSSWIMELNANDGNRLYIPPFDVNGDGIIDEKDVMDYMGEKTIVSGTRSREGIVASPGILNNNNGASELKFFSGTKGGIDVVSESAVANFRKRQSWRQLR